MLLLKENVMKLSSLLNEDLIFLNASLSSKEQAISFLLGQSAKKFHFSAREKEIHSLVLAREALGGTTFPSSLAVPHARIPDFDDIIIAVALPKVPFHEGNVSVRMVTLLLTSESNPAVYLNTLSSFAKMSMNRELFELLLKPRSAREFIEIVDKQNYRVTKDILVENIMTPPVFSVAADVKLNRITDLMFENHLSYVPVVGSQGELLGEIRLIDIINFGIPDYAHQIRSLGFTMSLEPFEKFFHEEDHYLAADIMKRPISILNPKSSLLDAAMELSGHGLRQLPVVESGRLLGVVSVTDILTKVIRG